MREFKNLDLQTTISNNSNKCSNNDNNGSTQTRLPKWPLRTHNNYVNITNQLDDYAVNLEGCRLTKTANNNKICGDHLK